MPKIIPDLQNRILEVARKHLIEDGYEGLKIRAVAKDCNIAIGTIYNYYAGKTELMNAVMTSDWQKTMEECRAANIHAESVSEAAVSIYSFIRRYVEDNRSLIEQDRRRNAPQDIVAEHRAILTSSIRELIESSLTSFNKEESSHVTSLVAELILTSALQDHIEPHSVKELTNRIFA